VIKEVSQIKKITVLGAGTMGPGIAQSYAMGGFAVTVWTRSEDTLNNARVAVAEGFKSFLDEGLLSYEKVDEFERSIDYTTDFEKAVKDADFIQETIVENKDAKLELFENLLKYIKDDCIVASNTSALNIFEIVPKEILKNIVIAHWYAPAQLIPLVEVVKAVDAPEEYGQITKQLLEMCGKKAILMKKFIPGYIVNRLQMCLNQEVFNLLDNDYCTPQDIDDAAKASFIPRAVVLGLCQRIDFGGLDMTASNFKNKSYTFPPEKDMPITLEKHIEKGELGFKAGKGFYDYSGLNSEEVIAKRDAQLFEIFKVAKKFTDDPLSK